jgi:Annexin
MRIADHGGVYRPEPEPPPPPPPPPPRPAPPAPEDGVDPVAAHSPAFDPPAPPAPQYTQQQADKDAKTLYDATEGGLTGWGTDEDAIWRTLDGKSAADIDKIRQSYRDHYGKDLDAVLRKETSGKDREHVDALLEGKENRAETDAVKIQAELAGAFGDREEVLEILEKASPDERRAIAEAYARKYGGQTSENVGQDPQEYLLSKIAENPSFGAEERERAGNLLGAASARTP